MWIIFDLDDTLVQTTKVSTPYLFQKIAFFLVQKYPHKNGAEIAKDLQYLNQTEAGSFEALKKYFQKEAIDSQHFSYCQSILDQKMGLESPVEPMPGAMDCIKKIIIKHRLALVSRGVRPLQMQKLKKAGIDSQVFSKIIVSSKGKKKSYKTILQLGGGMANRYVALGDRPLVDLKPAQELGFHTIHFKQGRGSYLKSSYHDFTLSSLAKLPILIDEIEKRIEYGND